MNVLLIKDGFINSLLLFLLSKQDTVFDGVCNEMTLEGVKNEKADK